MDEVLAWLDVDGRFDDQSFTSVETSTVLRSGWRARLFLNPEDHGDCGLAEQISSPKYLILFSRVSVYSVLCVELVGVPEMVPLLLSSVIPRGKPGFTLKQVNPSGKPMSNDGVICTWSSFHSTPSSGIESVYVRFEHAFGSIVCMSNVSSKNPKSLNTLTQQPSLFPADVGVP